MEKAEADELFAHQLHPYTKGLMSAIPIPNIHAKRERIHMQGEIQSPVEPKPGCRFAPRCPYAADKCRAEMPPLEEVLPGHFCACHRVRELNGL